MVNHWISLRNNKLYKKCLNYKIINIFNNSESFFYGDYDLDIYIGTKNDYPNLDSISYKVIKSSDGWIETCNIEEPQHCYYTLSEIISFFGWIQYKSFKKI